jgi:hypothetical protein
MSYRMPVAAAFCWCVLLGCQAWADPRPAAPGGRVEILVDGVPQPAYGARGAWYIEALKGRPYAIRISNPYPVRVAVALAIDGLNSIDARHTAAAAARKWVIEPYGTVTISGWQTSLSDARRFEFTTEARSYGARLGMTADLGVISAVYYRERVQYLAQEVPVAVRGRVGSDEAGARAGAESGRAGEAAAKGRPDMPAPAPASAAPANDGYAATGIGGRIDHAVREVALDLEDTPALSVAIRYEYRAELVRLGVLPALPPPDAAMDRRERAKGFAQGFCPEPKRWD